MTAELLLIWDVNEPVEVARAKKSFDRLIRSGYSAFRFDPNDEPFDRIGISNSTSFDPTLGKVVLSKIEP